MDNYILTDKTRTATITPLTLIADDFLRNFQIVFFGVFNLRHEAVCKDKYNNIKPIILII